MKDKFVVGTPFDDNFKKLVMADFSYMCDEFNLLIDDEAKKLLLLQSIQGHATEGHCCFEKAAYPQTTIEDIVNALDLEPEEVKAQRQVYIDEIFEFRDRILSGEKVKKYQNTEGEPLFRMPFFNHLEIENPGAALLGISLASKMDNYSQWRKKVEQKTGLYIGGGECIGVNIDEMNKRGMEMQDFKKKEYSLEEKAKLEKEGLLVNDVASSPNIVQSYLRLSYGYGTSDDLAILLAGKLYGLDAAWGIFLCDAVDTWDKYAPFIHKNGQDEQLGYEIDDNKEVLLRHGKVLPREDDVLKFISLIAKDNYKKLDENNTEVVEMKSESQRYLLQVNPSTGMSSIHSHMMFLMDLKPPKMNLGDNFRKITNSRMYNLFQEKFKQIYH